MKRFFKVLKWLGILFCIIILGIVVMLQTPPFGASPDKKALVQIEKSSHYKNDQFQNLIPTPDLAEGLSVWEVLEHNLFTRDSESTPKGTIPTIKTNLKQLLPTENVIVWMGHSSSFVQVDGKKILMDPILTESLFPIGNLATSYKGTAIYTPDDMPEIDVLLISHDHWDHLSYATVKTLQPKVKLVICGLGTGAHFRRWGYREDQIQERDWMDSVEVDSSFRVIVTPARHNSGRAFSQKKTQWASFVIKTSRHSIFFSGDSGYGPHFKTIGERYGPFDWAFMECGQYDKDYPNTHMQPEQSFEAMKAIKTTHVLPVHWGRFTESRHAWDEPIIRISKLMKGSGIALATPMIGQKVNMDSVQYFIPWWQEVK